MVYAHHTCRFLYRNRFITSLPRAENTYLSERI